MKKIIFIFIILAIIIFIILIKNNYKNTKIGNNIINQSADEIKENILNIESYEANVQITINSNKTTNTYEAKQSYYKEKNLYKQEIMSPESMKGTIFEYDGTNLQIKNTRLNLSKIYKNYNYIGSNELSLIAFIEDYQNNENIDYESDNEIILEVNVKNNNKYRKTKKLYISKNTKLPIKLEIQDNAQNTLVYILYNEIEINKSENKK